MLKLKLQYFGHLMQKADSLKTLMLGKIEGRRRRGWQRRRRLNGITDSMGFPDTSVGSESTCNEGDPGSIAGSGRSSWEGIGYPLQYSGLENFMDCIVHGFTNSQTWLNDFHFLFFHWPNGHEFEQTPGNGQGQGSLACSNPWGRKRVGYDWAIEQ